MNGAVINPLRPAHYAFICGCRLLSTLSASVKLFVSATSSFAVRNNPQRTIVAPINISYSIRGSDLQRRPLPPPPLQDDEQLDLCYWKSSDRTSDLLNFPFSCVIYYTLLQWIGLGSLGFLYYLGYGFWGCFCFPGSHGHHNNKFPFEKRSSERKGLPTQRCSYMYEPF